MNAQEALERILDASFEDDYQISWSVHRPDDEEIKILQELVDRATPKKPIMRDDNEYLECPNCDYPLSKTNYCEHCGQALDWTNESEQIAKGETK